MFDATLTGLDAWLDELTAAIDRGADAGMDAASRLVADEARADHEYINHTGDLQSSTRAIDVSGRASDDTLRGGVVADEDYGEYVEARKPFLAPAWDRREDDAARVMERALDAALR